MWHMREQERNVDRATFQVSSIIIELAKLFMSFILKVILISVVWVSWRMKNMTKLSNVSDNGVRDLRIWLSWRWVEFSHCTMGRITSKWCHLKGVSKLSECGWENTPTFYTYEPFTQWAAVRIHSFVMMVPPQKWKLKLFRRETCKRHQDVAMQVTTCDRCWWLD